MWYFISFLIIVFILGIYKIFNKFDNLPDNYTNVRENELDEDEYLEINAKFEREVCVKFLEWITEEGYVRFKTGDWYSTKNVSHLPTKYYTREMLFDKYKEEEDWDI